MFTDCHWVLFLWVLPFTLPCPFLSFKNPMPLSTGNEHVNVQRTQWPGLNTPLLDMPWKGHGARWGPGLAVALATPDEPRKLGCWGRVGPRVPDYCAGPREPCPGSSGWTFFPWTSATSFRLPGFTCHRLSRFWCPWGQHRLSEPLWVLQMDVCVPTTLQIPVLTPSSQCNDIRRRVCERW